LLGGLRPVFLGRGGTYPGPFHAVAGRILALGRPGPETFWPWGARGWNILARGHPGVFLASRGHPGLEYSNPVAHAARIHAAHPHQHGHPGHRPDTSKSRDSGKPSSQRRPRPRAARPASAQGPQVRRPRRSEAPGQNGVKPIRWPPAMESND
jgi:hypothetical protein